MLLEDAPNYLRMTGLQHDQVQHRKMIDSFEQIADLGRVDELSLTRWSLKKQIVLFQLVIHQFGRETHLAPLSLHLIFSVLDPVTRYVQNTQIFLQHVDQFLRRCHLRLNLHL